MNKIIRPYQKLEELIYKINVLNQSAEMLSWDMSTMMPSGGSKARSEQLSVLNSVIHTMITSPEVSDLLNEIDEDNNLIGWEKSNVKEIRSRWLKASAIDTKLVIAFTRARIKCEAKWRDAREKNNFRSLHQELTELIDLIRETGQAKAQALGLDLYDALLHDFEPGFNSKEIDAIFDDLSNFLPDLTEDVLTYQSHQSKPKEATGFFPIKKQIKLAKLLMGKIGFDFNHGRLDTSLHPFCGGNAEDIRITTRYDENNFTSSMMGVLHETGHAIYERGLPEKWRNQPVGEALGMGMHESQSLLIEMQLCRSPEFLEYVSPYIQDIFSLDAEVANASNLFKLYTQVQPGYIRVEADEVTYPAHVILRYRLEQLLLSGSLSVRDLPDAWNQHMKNLLGIKPPDDKLGCLQDIHWYDGAWGYFPSYTLGAIVAAQIYDTAKKNIGSLNTKIRKGDFSPLLLWLRSNIHSKGRSIGSQELLAQVTGKAIDVQIFKKHLIDRYLK